MKIRESCFIWFFPLGGKISIGGGVVGAVDAAKAAGLPTVGTA